MQIIQLISLAPIAWTSQNNLHVPYHLVVASRQKKKSINTIWILLKIKFWDLKY